jgi:aromatic ring-opening dioxygenase catalytic subunit (LigB family)
MIGDQALQLDDGSWLTLETADDGARLIALFTSRQWDVLEVAEKAMVNANMKTRLGRAIVAGVYKDAVVLAARVPSHQLDPRTFDAVMMELRRFRDGCIPTM